MELTEKMKQSLSGALLQARSVIAQFAQWLAFVFALLMVVGALLPLERIGIEGVSSGLVYAQLGGSVFAALIFFPPIFWRIPAIARVGAYVGFMASFLFTVIVSTQVREAYERTPQGAKAAAVQAAADRKALAANAEADRKTLAAKAEADQRAAVATARRDDAKRSLAKLEGALEEVAVMNRKLEACFSTFGHHLTGLEDPVKESLHNPRAFEHVKTVVIVPDDDRNNVQMTFRAENAFGAIRTATVRAQLIADDCSIQNIGEPNIE